MMNRFALRLFYATAAAVALLMIFAPLAVAAPRHAVERGGCPAGNSIDRHGPDRCADGNSIDGNSIDGNSIDGNSIDGNSIDGGLS